MHVTGVPAEIRRKMDDVFTFAKSTFGRVQPFFEGDRRTGFAFTIVCGTPNNGVWQTNIIGLPPPSKRDKYHFLSGEKVWRALCAGSLSSMDTADFGKERYAGGLVMPPWGYGISGLYAPLDDHCLAAAYAVAAGGFDEAKMRRDYLVVDNLETRFDRFLGAMRS